MLNQTTQEFIESERKKYLVQLKQGLGHVPKSVDFLGAIRLKEVLSGQVLNDDSLVNIEQGIKDYLQVCRTSKIKPDMEALCSLLCFHFLDTSEDAKQPFLEMCEKCKVTLSVLLYYVIRCSNRGLALLADDLPMGVICGQVFYLVA